MQIHTIQRTLKFTASWWSNWAHLPQFKDINWASERMRSI